MFCLQLCFARFGEYFSSGANRTWRLSGYVPAYISENLFQNFSNPIQDPPAQKLKKFLFD